MSQRAFISHACADDKFVHKLASDLKKLGAAVWVSDWERESGITWPDKLANAIRESPLFVLVMSPASKMSREVEKELDQALQLRRIIVPVRYRDCDTFDRVRLLDYEDFRRGDYGQALTNLYARLTGGATQTDASTFESSATPGSFDGPPRTLAAPTLQPQQQFTAMTLLWSPVPHAEYYEVQKSDSTFFSDAITVYKDVGTTYSVPGGARIWNAQDIRYYRVRAVAVTEEIASHWSNVCTV